MSNLAWLVPPQNEPHVYLCWPEADHDVCNHEFYDAEGLLRCCNLPRVHPIHVPRES